MAGAFDLEIYRGEQRVRTEPLGPGGACIGRDEGNEIVLADPKVSKRHAYLSAREDRVQVRDLGSSHGTFIGGKRVNAAELAAGGELEIGPFRVRVITRATRAVVPVPSEPRSTSGPATSGSLLDWASLVGVTDVEVLLLALLEQARTATGASRGHIVLARDGALSSVAARAGAGEDDEPFSRTVCRRAVETRAIVHLGSPEEMAWVGSSESLASSPRGTIMAVPLEDAGEILGVVHLESDRRVRLDGAGELLGQLRVAGGRALRAAIERKALIRDKDRWSWLASAQHEEPDIFLTARSPSMQRAVDTIRKVAGEDVTVLMNGESGSGKEVAAHMIHRLSPRHGGPFIAINCGAIPRELMEAELFGYEKGAFTGAAARTAGRLELAQGGTLLLDEIGDLPPELQVKLLRVLETRTFERVGGREPIHWDARLIAATHRDLTELVAKGQFRQDLFYRLNVITIRLPGLRERLDDLEGLVHELLVSTNRKLRRKLLGVTPEALAALRAYSWPGNVRELRNVIERAFILETSDRITAASLPFGDQPSPRPGAAPAPPRDEAPIQPLEEFLERQERDYIRMVLDRVGGNVTHAARALQVARTALHRKLKSFGIKRTIDWDPEQE